MPVVGGPRDQRDRRCGNPIGAWSSDLRLLRSDRQVPCCERHMGTPIDPPERSVFRRVADEAARQAFVAVPPYWLSPSGLFRNDGVEKKECAGRESREATADCRRGRMASSIGLFPICGLGRSGALPHSLPPYRRPVPILPARGDPRESSPEPPFRMAAEPRSHAVGSQSLWPTRC